MAAAATLGQAAEDAPANMLVQWLAGTLPTALTNFCNDLIPTYLEATPSDHPSANWLAVISAFAQPLVVGLNGAQNPNMTHAQFEQAVRYIYNICMLTSSVGKNIGSGGGAGMLASYNARFG